MPKKLLVAEIVNDYFLKNPSLEHSFKEDVPTIHIQVCTNVSGDSLIVEWFICQIQTLEVRLQSLAIKEEEMATQKGTLSKR